VIDVHELRTRVDAAFVRTNRDTPPWPDPHPDRSAVPDEAYSRLTDPARWRILGARTDAWALALVESGLARVETEGPVTWTEPPHPAISRTERIVPRAAGALELVIAHTPIGDAPDAGIVLGVGDPAECVIWIPDCGCDACDTGSRNELDHLDSHLDGIVTGAFRRVTDGTRVVTVIGDGGWSSSGFGPRARAEVDAVLADAAGWDELTGSSWLDAGS
jgi:hypothetical protein